MENKLNNYKQLIFKISREIFSIFLIGYLIMFLLDEIFTDMISNFFNLNYLLVIILIFGFLTVFLEDKNEVKEQVKAKKNVWLDKLLIILLGLVAVIVVYFKIKDIGIILSIIIALCSGLLISLISYMFLSDTEEDRL